MASKQSYLGNPNLKGTGVSVDWTPESVKEYTKCTESPLYFIKNYVQIVNVDRGLVPFDMWDFQEDMINQFHNNRFVICKMPRQTGKCFSENSNIQIRNKNTGEIRTVEVGSFFNEIKNESNINS